MPLPHFRLEPGEPLGDGLKRLSLIEIESAVSRFYDGEEEFRGAVHEARKTTKRLRAMLRLIRDEIGEKAFRYENTAMRSAGRALSPVRSAAVAVDSVGLITSIYGTLLAPDTFEQLIDRLSIRRDRMEERMMEDPEVLPRIITIFEKAHRRYAAWPTGPEMKSIYGVGIRDSYEAVGPGLRATYARGREEMVSAYRDGSSSAFHRWRKRVKYLRHQLEILTPLWPEVILGTAITLDRMGELLGEDNDLAEIQQVVRKTPDLCPNPLERSLLSALAEQRRADLETASRILGRRVYAETPEAVDLRVGAYWESFKMAGDFVPLAATG